MKTAFLFGQNKKKKNTERASAFPALLFVVTILVLCVIILFLPIKKALIVSNETTRKILFTLPIKSGEMISLKFTHSVNLSPVVDHYQFDGTIIILRSTTFQTYGAGIPILEDYNIGVSFKQTENGFEINEIDLPREKILVMLQTIPDQRISYRGKEIRLLDVTKTGTIVAIMYGKVPLINYFLTELKIANKN